MSDLDLLRRLGDDLVPPPLDALRETARRRDRRAAATTALVAGTAVAVVATGVTLLAPGGAARARGPAYPPTRDAPTSRPLTYAEGSTVHYGDRAVEAAGRVDELDLTDQGVTYRTSDGRIWFTDGTTTDQVGSLDDPVEPSGDLDSWIWDSRFSGDRSTGWIISGNSGSVVAWFDTPELVAYDTATREVVLRINVDVPPGGWVAPHSVTPDSVYLFHDPDPAADDEMPQERVDLGNGVRTPITPDEYLADVVSRPARSLLVSHAEQGFELHEITEGTGHQVRRAPWAAAADGDAAPRGPRRSHRRGAGHQGPRGLLRRQPALAGPVARRRARGGLRPDRRPGPAAGVPGPDGDL
jgi:hypothetical protein